MSLKQKIKNYPRLYQFLFYFLHSFRYFDKRFWIYFPKYRMTEFWRKRTDVIKLCPDNQKIKIVDHAGKIYRHYQLMHNGLRIRLGSYYDYGNTMLLQETNGVHEPQEEFAFQEILKAIPEGGVMMELGSFWAFYSMWFASVVKNARCVMIEPDPHKINFGKLNFKLNNLKGVFDLGFISDHDQLKTSIPTYSVDYLVKKHSIEFLDVLHSDIQGYELKMLHGASTVLKNKKIGLLFISTHSNPLHSDCEQFLKKIGYTIICSANLTETYSWDGLIVAQSPDYLRKFKIEISKRE